MGKKIASLYAEISADTTKLQKGLTESEKKLKKQKEALDEVVKGVTGFSLTQIGAVGAVFAVTNAVKQGITEWQNYALSSKDASAALGVTVEDFTRLVQVGDDVRLSQENLTTAMQMMAKNGVAPSIENLAKLSDELRGMEITDRAAKLSQLFGRNWREVYKILENGGDALKNNTKAVADGLVVTEEAAEASANLYTQLDQLNEQFETLKNTTIKGLVPGLAATTWQLNKNIEMLERGVPIWEILAFNQKLYNMTQEQVNLTMGLSVDPILSQARAIYSDAGAHVALNAAMKDTWPTVDATGERYQAQADKIIAANKTAAESIKTDIAAALDVAREAADKWIEGAGGDVATELGNADLSAGDFNKALIALDGAMGTSYYNAKLQGEATKKIVDEYKKTGDVDAFKDSLLRLKNGGFIPLLDDVKTAREQIALLYQDLRLIDGDFTAHVYVDLPSSGGSGTPGKKPTGTGSNAPPRKAGGHDPTLNDAVGGPASNYGWVGEQGPEIQVGGRGTYVLSNKDAMAAVKGDGIVINMYLTGYGQTPNAQILGGQVAREIQRRM